MSGPRRHGQMAPDRIALADQVTAMLRTQAQLLGYYYRQLRSQGVPMILAMALVRDWHQIVNLPDCTCEE